MVEDIRANFDKLRRAVEEGNPDDWFQESVKEMTVLDSFLEEGKTSTEILETFMHGASLGYKQEIKMEALIDYLSMRVAGEFYK